jgi:hypothetical protein
VVGPTGITGPTGATGTLLYNFNFFPPIGKGAGYAGYTAGYVAGYTGSYTMPGGPQGPAGPPNNTTLILTIGFRWHIPGAMYCLPGFGPTGIFLDEGFPFKGSS